MAGFGVPAASYQSLGCNFFAGWWLSVPAPCENGQPATQSISFQIDHHVACEFHGKIEQLLALLAIHATSPVNHASQLYRLDNTNAFSMTGILVTAGNVLRIANYENCLIPVPVDLELRSDLCADIDRIIACQLAPSKAHAPRSNINLLAPQQCSARSQ